jgi:type IV pilus assembly protein PilA
MNFTQQWTKRARINYPENGFTLPEVMVTVSIVGILSSIALPAYLEQKTASCQGYPESIISQAMMQAQAHKDEYGKAAKGWSELDKIGTIMTSSGPAKGSSFEWIRLPSCGYKLMASYNAEEYTFNATQENAFIKSNQLQTIEVDPQKNKFNVVGCLNVATGASDIQRGDGTSWAQTSSLNCG